jgi:DNA-binding NtrC family response regulator
MFRSRGSTRASRGAHGPEFDPHPDGRIRVVVENEDFAERFVARKILEEAGFDVVGCGGPAELAGSRCPLTVGEDCAAIRDADVVVSSFRVEGSQGAEILASIRRRYPETPVIVEAPGAAVQGNEALLEGCHVVFPLTAGRLRDTVNEVIGSPSRS